MFDIETERRFVLNQSALVAWQRLHSWATVEDIAGALMLEFGIAPDQATRDASELVELLLREGLIARKERSELEA